MAVDLVAADLERLTVAQIGVVDLRRQHVDRMNAVVGMQMVGHTEASRPASAPPLMWSAWPWVSSTSSIFSPLR